MFFLQVEFSSQSNFHNFFLALRWYSKDHYSLCQLEFVFLALEIAKSISLSGMVKVGWLFFAYSTHLSSQTPDMSSKYVTEIRLGFLVPLSFSV